jgi:hypothetical protein
MRRAIGALLLALAAELAAGVFLVRAADVSRETTAHVGKETVYDRVYEPRQHLVIMPETGDSWIETESGERHYLTIGNNDE